MSNSLELEILSPEKLLYKGKVRVVRLPGQTAPFTVLPNHAPLLSALEKGEITYETADEPATTGSLSISGGFVEIVLNQVKVCVEL